MATVGTSTQSDLLSWPTIPGVTRDFSIGSISGYLYAVIRTAADTLTFYRSTNGGTSWSSWTAMTHVGLQEWSRIQLDRYGFAHIAYRVGTGTADTIWYRRVNLFTANWNAALQVSNTDANSGSIGSRWQGVDLAVVRHSNGAYAILVAGAFTYPGLKFGVWSMGVSIDTGGGITVNNGIIVNNRSWFTAGTAPGRSGVVVEIEHTGDGVSSSTPHAWIAWGRTGLRMVKLAWQGTSVGWSGPSSYQTIRPTIAAHNYIGGRWDGRQWCMSVINPDDATTVRIYQRNQANTLTSAFDTPTHPTGNVTNMATSYDATTQDIRVYAVGTSTAVLYYCDYTRATGVWTSWATVTATAVLSSTEWTVRAGGSAGDAKHHVLTTASGSPNTVSEISQSSSSVPSIATWDTSAQPYSNGGAADVGAALTLAWTFSDPDPGQTQGSYALSKQVGVGTVQYWNASTTSWGVSEVQNSTATQSLTLASGWAAGTDANHTFKVKVWDSTNVPAVSYSDPLILIPSVKVNPTLTYPTGTPTVNADTITATWTVAEQTQYRVRLFSNPGNVLVYSSGDVTDSTTTSFQIPYVLPTGATGWTVELRTKNNEGLASTSQLGNFNVAYSPPPAMVSTFTPSTTTGVLAVTGTALAVVGSQPAITSADLYRRPAISPALNANPTFAGNITGWRLGGGATGTFSYSTTQFHEGPGAARYVPNAGVAAPQIEGTAGTTIDPTKIYYASGWIRPDTASKPAFILVSWYDASDVFISNSVAATITTPVAAAWQFLEVVADPTGVVGAAKARVGIGESSTPAAADAWYADEVKLELYDATTPIRIATGLLPPVTYNDWGAASGIEYEYRWLVNGANGTSIYGPWTQ